MSTPVPLNMQAGVPYGPLVITLTDGKNVWADLSGCEVRAQVRKYQSETAPLLLDLTPHLTVAFSGNNIAVTLSVTGAVTRSLARANGHWDLIISDTGTTDARAILLAAGPVSVGPVVTSAS